MKVERKDVVRLLDLVDEYRNTLAAVQEVHEELGEVARDLMCRLASAELRQAYQDWASDGMLEEEDREIAMQLRNALNTYKVS